MKIIDWIMEHKGVNIEFTYLNYTIPMIQITMGLNSDILRIRQDIDPQKFSTDILDVLYARLTKGGTK